MRTTRGIAVGRRLAAAAGCAVLGAVVVAPAAGAASGSDPLVRQQHGLEESGLHRAWATSTGTGVTIAILDSGVDGHHPDLVSRLVPGHNEITGSDDTTDDDGHGTHVAGIAAAATGNGVGVAGGAPGAKVMPVKVLDAQGRGNPATIAAGMVWAAQHGARVINLSLNEDSVTRALLHNRGLALVVRQVAAQGVVVVVAAGNDGVQVSTFVPTPPTPALVVSAVDASGAPAPFTDYGDPEDVAAPGTDILSTAPTYPTPVFAAGGPGRDIGGYGVLSGTSMAAPFVSAEAALLLAQGRDAEEVRAVIQSTARSPHGDKRLGHGLIDAAAAVAAPRAPTADQREQVELASVSPAAYDHHVISASERQRRLVIVVVALGLLLTVATGTAAQASRSRAVRRPQLLVAVPPG